MKRTAHVAIQSKIMKGIKKVKVTLLCPGSLWCHGLEVARFLCPWDFPGKNTEVGSHFLLQGIFPTKGSNPGLPHYRKTLII